MDIVSIIFWVALVFVVAWFVNLRFRIAKKREDYYYNRLYWTVRNAQEDAQRSRGDRDKNE